MIFGSIEGEPVKQEDGWMYRIRPYLSKGDLAALTKDYDRIDWSEQNNDEPKSEQKGLTLRLRAKLNLITERLKWVRL